ncbi:MAG: phenylalanine--tRNA ligase subunit alpha, partial [Deltaproteobacteria bacterium]
MLKDLEALVAAARREIPQARGRDAAEALRVKYLGKKGELQALLRGMGNVPAAERPAAGAAVNSARDELEALVAAAIAQGERAALDAELKSAPLDVTLPGRRLAAVGRRHPVSQALDDIVEILARMGYEV